MSRDVSDSPACMVDSDWTGSCISIAMWIGSCSRMRYNSKNPFKVRPTPAVGQSTYMHPLMLASTPAPDISPSRIKAVSGMDAQAASSSIGSSSMVADSAGSPTVKVEDEASLELEMPDVPTVQDAQGAVQGVELCAGTEGQTEDAGRQDVEAGGVNIKGKKRQGSPTLDERDTKRPTMTTPDVAQSGPASGSASAEKPIPAPLKKHALAAPASPTAGTQRSPRKAAEDFFDLYPKRHYGPDGERLASGAPPSGSAAVTGTEPQVTVATVPSEPAESSARDSASEPTNTSNDAQTSATSSALTSDHHSPSTSVPLTDATDAEKGSSQAAQPAAGTSVSVEVGPGQQDASGGTSSTESESSNNDHQPSPVTGDARGALDSSAPAQPTATPNAAEVKTEAVEHVGQAIVSADEDHSASDQSMETVQAVIPQADTALSRPDTETISTAGSAAAIDDVDQTDSVVITPGYYGKGEDWWTDSRFANREHSVLVPPCEIPLRFYLAEGFPPGLKNVLVSLIALATPKRLADGTACGRSQATTRSQGSQHHHHPCTTGQDCCTTFPSPMRAVCRRLESYRRGEPQMVDGVYFGSGMPARGAVQG